ncbi:hypothetical protein J8273_1177 [Carpediemonas membranifera]|uniref:Uncharacterized protein n=1 Tax=Carpediemonas membranifera TaxID=201153 RepID=A0A8J6BCB7_9EUKA|nr:hypothetical protein J8273_1177 [Carpediemonas membranifera]|eukprot:KAG9397262.1 hypothetical protein J8273_1177 [Carpediemonas membranifera]
MGVNGLLSYVSGRDNNKKMREYKAKDVLPFLTVFQPGKSVVFDGNSILHFLYRKINYGHLGGDLSGFRRLTGQFFKLFLDLGCQVTIFFDGCDYGHEIKAATAHDRANSRLNRVSTLFASLPTTMTDPMNPNIPVLHPLTRAAFMQVLYILRDTYRADRLRIMVCDTEADSFVMKYAIARGFGPVDPQRKDRFNDAVVVTNDSDALLYTRVPMVVVCSAMHIGSASDFEQGNFDIAGGSVTVLRPEQIARTLGLPDRMLQVLAVLVGNDYISTDLKDMRAFHKRITTQADLDNRTSMVEIVRRSCLAMGGTLNGSMPPGLRDSNPETRKQACLVALAKILRAANAKDAPDVPKIRDIDGLAHKMLLALKGYNLPDIPAEASHEWFIGNHFRTPLMDVLGDEATVGRVILAYRVGYFPALVLDTLLGVTVGPYIPIHDPAGPAADSARVQLLVTMASYLRGEGKTLEIMRVTHDAAEETETDTEEGGKARIVAEHFTTAATHPFLGRQDGAVVVEQRPVPVWTADMLSFSADTSLEHFKAMVSAGADLDDEASLLFAVSLRYWTLVSEAPEMGIPSEHKATAAVVEALLYLHLLPQDGVDTALLGQAMSAESETSVQAVIAQLAAFNGICSIVSDLYCAVGCPLGWLPMQVPDTTAVIALAVGGADSLGTMQAGADEEAAVLRNFVMG